VPGGAHAYDPGSADVENADFASLKEKGRAGFLGVGQRERGGRGYGGSDDHAVEVRVMRRDLAGLEESGDHELLAQRFRAERVGLGGTREIMQFHRADEFTALQAWRS
jgi:hypothetical protein